MHWCLVALDSVIPRDQRRPWLSDPSSELPGAWRGLWEFAEGPHGRSGAGPCTPTELLVLTLYISRFQINVF